MASRAPSAPFLVFDIDRARSGGVDDALEDRPQRPKHLTDRDRPTGRSGTRRIGGLGVVGGEGVAGEAVGGGGVHAAEDGDALRDTTVRTKQVAITGASVQREDDVGASPKHRMRFACATVRFSLEALAVLLGVSVSRAQAKLDPKRTDAPLRWDDVEVLVDTPGKPREVARMMLAPLLAKLAEDDGPEPREEERGVLDFHLFEAQRTLEIRRREFHAQPTAKALVALRQAQVRRDQLERRLGRIEARMARAA